MHVYQTSGPYDNMDYKSYGTGTSQAWSSTHSVVLSSNVNAKVCAYYPYLSTRSFDGNTYTYDQNLGRLTTATTGNPSATAMSIPCRLITSITLPTSVINIDGAFSNCSGLTSIEVPPSVTTIGGATFANCTNLESVLLKGTVSSLGKMAFMNCTKLNSLNLPDALTSIESYAFQNCANLANLKVPSGMSSIGSCTFNHIPLDNVHFLDLPFYESGKIEKLPMTEKDVEIVRALLKEVKPHQIYVAGDLADPHAADHICDAEKNAVGSQLRKIQGNKQSS